MEHTHSNIKILNRDMMKYIAYIPMFIGHMIAWINLMNHPENDLALYELPLPLILIAGLSLFCPLHYLIILLIKIVSDRL